jgi:HEPN domain-containing protein
MTDPQPDVDVATRWLREAAEELRAAEVVAAHEELPDRVAGFHAHLAAEKALKAELIRLDVEVPRIHDLIGLHRLLPESEQGRFDGGDLEALNPWTIEGRYPADLPDSDRSMIEESLAAARRVLDAATTGEVGDV